jgi:hypothetical protein
MEDEAGISVLERHFKKPVYRVSVGNSSLKATEYQLLTTSRRDGRAFIGAERYLTTVV